MNKQVEAAAIAETYDRRSPDRTEDADWESKVLGRVGGHLKMLTHTQAELPTLGWEASVLDSLRRRIEQGPK